jgi:DmsE family decaheme c-type cytochrome
MSKHIRKIGPKVWLACGLAVWLVTLVSVRASEPAGQDAARPSAKKSAAAVKAPQAAAAAKPAAQAPAQAAALVGQDTCLTCHDDKRKGYEGSSHSIKTDARTPAAKQSCESCHGPGGKHAEDPAANPLLRFSKAKPEEINAACATCHNKGEHALWQGSQHESRGVSCVTCHSVHDFKSAEKQLKATSQRELCATCHRDKISKLDRSGHMPVREGKMQCTSCHNVHGSTNVRLLAKGESVAESCTACHADKRGPYLWEHAPVRDGCVTCHDPHGSSNERMLVAKAPLLCQRCHVATRHPSTIYDALVIGPTTPAPSVRVYGRSCVTCHAAIHGSNHPSGQRFIR